MFKYIFFILKSVLSYLMHPGKMDRGLKSFSNFSAPLDTN